MSEAKLPWLKFFPSDWLSDPALGRCSPTTRGIWIDMVCLMHQSGGTGEISCSLDEFSRICRCSPDEANKALEELNLTKTADVTFCNSLVTVTNRRMKRDYKYRYDTRLRVQRYRSNASSNKSVTQEMSEVRVQRSDKEPPNPLKGGKVLPPEKPQEVLIEFPDKLKTPLMMQKWGAWMNHRRAFKKPKSWVAMFNEQIRWLSQYDEPTAVSIITKSLMNGYQGLIEPKSSPINGHTVQKQMPLAANGQQNI